MMTALGFLQGTYIPLVHAHAGRTQLTPADILYAVCIDIVHSASLHFSTIQPSHKMQMSKALSNKRNKKHYS